MVGESSDVRLLDARECLEVAEQHRDLIVGIKVRVGRNTSEGYGVFPLELAVEVAEELAPAGHGAHRLPAARGGATCSTACARATC